MTVSTSEKVKVNGLSRPVSGVQFLLEIFSIYARFSSREFIP